MHSPAAWQGKPKPCPANCKGTRDSPGGWESKWPGHSTPFLLPTLLKGICGKMGCVHQQASPVPSALLPLTAPTLRMDMRTASPPVRVNIRGCYVVAGGDVTLLPRASISCLIPCFLSLHPVWAPSCLYPEDTLRKHCIL